MKVHSVRVRTAEGTAFFRDSTGTAFTNEYGAQWLHVPEGAEVELCAMFGKTDTFLVALTLPAVSEEDSEDGEAIPAMVKGLALRRASWEKLQKAEQKA